MVFTDIVENFNRIKEALDELNPYYDAAIQIQECSDKMVESTIQNTYVSYTSNNYVPLGNIIKENINTLTATILKQNTLKLGQLLYELKKNEKDTIQSNLIKEMSKSIEEFYNSSYEFSNAPKGEIPNKCINLIINSSKFIYTYDMFKGFINELNNFKTLLMSNSDEVNDTNTFSIRLYNENLSLQEINGSIKVISEIYEKTCEIFNISSSDYPLKPIKIESGSFLGWLTGSDKAFAFMTDLINRAIDFIYRNYTKEGKLNNAGTKIDILKQEINLIELCEKHGIDTTKAKDTLEDNLNILCNDVYKLTTSSSKISINGKIHDLKESINGKLLANTSINLLTEKEPENQ